MKNLNYESEILFALFQFVAKINLLNLDTNFDIKNMLNLRNTLKYIRVINNSDILK